MYLAFLEHHKKKQYPQNIIILFLFLGCFTRTIWLFLPYVNKENEIIGHVFNRIAILFQFGAISMLMVMWSRALRLTYSFDQARAEINQSDQVQLDKKSLLVYNQRKRETELRALQDDLHLKQRIWLCVNVFAWLCIIITSIIDTGSYWYTVNLLMLSTLCLLVNIGIIVVGYSNWKRLRCQLEKLEEHSSRDTPHTSKDLSSSPLQMCCQRSVFFRVVFQHSYGQQRAQVEMLRIIAIVSLTVSIFFFIRSFCFLYVPVVEIEYNENWRIGLVIYPFFYYQLPELFPNIAIAWGISSPTGIFKRLSESLVLCCCGMSVVSQGLGGVKTDPVSVMSVDDPAGPSGIGLDKEGASPATAQRQPSSVQLQRQSTSSVDTPRGSTLVTMTQLSGWTGDGGDHSEEWNTNVQQLADLETSKALAAAMSAYIYTLNSFNLDPLHEIAAIDGILNHRHSIESTLSEANSRRTFAEPLEIIVGPSVNTTLSPMANMAVSC